MICRSRRSSHAISTSSSRTDTTIQRLFDLPPTPPSLPRIHGRGGRRRTCPPHEVLRTLLDTHSPAETMRTTGCSWTRLQRLQAQAQALQPPLPGLPAITHGDRAR